MNFKHCLAIFLFSLLTACGGGGSDKTEIENTPPVENTTPADEQDNSAEEQDNTETEILDVDNDGVLDSVDSCLDSKPNDLVDETGCINTEEVVDEFVEVAVDAGILIAGKDAGNPGFTLYVFDNDLNKSGSNCIDGCAVNWPPLLVTDQVATGIENLTTVIRDDGALQAAYNGRPLYYFINDAAIGDTKGSRVNGWDVQPVNSDSVDTDNDGVIDAIDVCPDTEPAVEVDATGCAIVVEVPSPLIEVDVANGILIAGKDAPNQGFTLYVFDNDLQQTGSTCNGGCAVNWPPLLVTDEVANGVINLTTVVRDDGTLQAAYKGRPLYYFINDVAVGDTNGSQIDGWDVQPYSVDVSLGDIVPLYNDTTVQEPAIIYETNDAVITKFADRGRDRHAKEDQFQQYDHYLSHYWTHRTARFKFTDHVAKGGSSIKVEWVSEWKLQALEFRAWYSGMNTVAQYHGNYEPEVVVEGHGTYDNDLVQTSTTGEQYKYSLTINDYRALNGSVSPLAIGQHMEIEVSQFLDGVPEGRSNYYGTTYLYQVGKGGMVPWKTLGDFDDKSSERENSHPIAKSGWLGGNTTLPYQYTNEPNDHFMQMATNLSSVNGQPFVLGRRILHTSFVNGQHDEDPANGSFAELSGKAGTHFVNDSCSSCHERNGRAAPAEVGVNLDKWVFKIADSNGEPDAERGRVLQPSNVGNVQGEGTVSLAAWTESNGLRSPNYQFSTGTPAKFSARIAPQLVGMGLLEAIPEQSILALEDVNDEVAPFGISGKAQKSTDPVTGQTRLGRFGWKAGASSVKHQIAGALNTDMGVMTSVLSNPDCGANQQARGECGVNTVELADQHLDNLVKYIALLGVRAQRDLDDTQVQNGQALFSNIGCNDCHVETLTTTEHHPLTELVGQTIHPYTDLLLHDMGEGLADNLGEGLATGAEWRTTPLWGIGLSACVTGGVINPVGGQGNEVCTPVHSYLHDGRARTIEEAILWHGGESQASKVKYQQLSTSDKNDLLSFLNSL
ncbi:di-heme oxidoredictase family protein [Thalassotalea fonticola]|uniref:Di-heme oxidoredictase family protein n=1 Tax=Thalassotalea fonticola TaxID=3065649 RepID=A0ABZ0GNZ8_9GAMM|nr:di-heme oxidoredictase family protein [Colwelliaceae bacterium S1-1]